MSIRVKLKRWDYDNCLAGGAGKMLDQKGIAKILKRNYPFLRSNYGIRRIGLFGSCAKGMCRSDSDIDIVVEFNEPIGFKFIELAEYLEHQLGKKVDILTPEGIKSIRVKEIAAGIEQSIIYV